MSDDPLYSRLGFTDSEWGLLVGLPQSVLTAASAAESDGARRTKAENQAGLAIISGGRESASPLVAAIARELIARCRELTIRVNDLEREITRLVRQLAPTLLELPGCGALSAAKIVGEVAGVARFRSKASFARWNGTAPVPVWSGNEARFRLNRGGNRQVNAALHRIAITQWRGVGPGHAYVAHRLATKPKPRWDLHAGSPEGERRRSGRAPRPWPAGRSGSGA